MSTTPGARMAAEIDEQPAVLDGLYARRGEMSDVAARIRAAAPRFVLLAARGSSDHAALYAKYLIEIGLGLPAGLVSPSATTLYGARPSLADVLLITISQSGGSPDLLEVTESARAAGALTVAVTNTPDSPLSAAAELGVHIGAGDELAVAATKTYTASLLAMYLLLEQVRGGDCAAAAEIGTLAAKTLETASAEVPEAVRTCRYVERIVTTGRGYSLATAMEAALKLAETSYLAARAYSGADLLHGPVAAVDNETAVLAATSNGRGGESLRDVLDVVRGGGADIIAVGSAAASMPVSTAVRVPDSAEEIAPVLEILPVQRLALGLSLARGGDPDTPRGLNKITRTR